uniref:Palmitoyltransferase n=1 Tax=Laticauda laticaudata TaxID=8630 RepID=A0A8C5WXF6_LATLA
GRPRHCLWRRAGPFLYWVPVLFICSILAWSYYAYVAQLCLLTISNIGEKMMCLIAYHLFFMMFLWSYWKTIFTLPMNPSKEFHLSYSDKELMEREPRNETHQEVLKRAAKDLPISTRTMSGAIRYCDRCQLIKPDRCHHCSVCDKCILKMDHHCPWVNNCVGFSNYKFFLLFLAYSLLYCLFIFATELQHFIRFWTVSFSSFSGSGDIGRYRAGYQTWGLDLTHRLLRSGLRDCPRNNKEPVCGASASDNGAQESHVQSS